MFSKAFHAFSCPQRTRKGRPELTPARHRPLQINPMSSGRQRSLEAATRLSRRRAGFSLVELIVVMVIIGMLATLVVLRTRSYLVNSKQNAARLEISRLSEALDSFNAVRDRFPTNDEGLAILAEKSDDAVDGFINKVPLDPWKNEYQYNTPGRDAPYEIVCLGADGREGGQGADADIISDDSER